MKEYNKRMIRLGEAVMALDNIDFEIHCHRPNYDHVTPEMLRRRREAEIELSSAKIDCLIYMRNQKL